MRTLSYYRNLGVQYPEMLFFHHVVVQNREKFLDKILVEVAMPPSDRNT